LPTGAAWAEKASITSSAAGQSRNARFIGCRRKRKFRLSHFRNKNKNRQQKKEMNPKFVAITFRLRRLLRRKLSFMWHFDDISAPDHENTLLTPSFFFRFFFRI
jgi:hypothetical protein